MEAPEPHHRHVSHLYALYPERPDHRARHAGAGGRRRKSLELRGDMSTGWAIAWRINLWARLRDGEHAHGVLKLLLDPVAHLSEHVRRASAVPDRRQLRRRRRHDGDAAAVCGRRDRAAARVAAGLGHGVHSRAARPRRVRSGYRVAQRSAGISRSCAARQAALAQVRYGAKLKAVRVARGQSVVLKVGGVCLTRQRSARRTPLDISSRLSSAMRTRSRPSCLAR